MKKINDFLPIIFLPLLFLSCWGDSSPTSDKTKAYIVSGTVIDKSSIGIGGVTVQITGTNYSLSDTTGTDGIFAFENVKSGDYSVKAQKDSCFFKPSKIEFSLAKTDIDTLKFTKADNYIHGKLLDIMNDKGLEGYTVTITPDKSILRFTATTDKNGYFEFFDIEKNICFVHLELDIFEYPFLNTIYKIELKSFNSPEIIIPDYYLSSEKLKITSASYSRDTKTLNLEWTPSSSEYVDGYMLYKRSAPFRYAGGRGSTSGSSYEENKVSIEITQKYVSNYFDASDSTGIMYFAVRALYRKDSNYLIFNSLISDDVSVRLYW